MTFGAKKVRLEFSLNWLLLVPLAGAGLIVAFIFVSDNVRPILIYSSAVAAGAAALITAINNVDSRTSAIASKATETNHAKVCAALGFCDRWNSPEFFRSKHAGRESILALRTRPNIEAQLAFLEEDAERRVGLMDILNFFEAMSIAMTKGVICEETAKAFFRSIVIEYWHGMEGVIKKRRAERGNTRLYQEFEALYNAWKA